MSKNLIRRIEKIERPSTMPRWRVAVIDLDGRFHLSETGQVLSKPQFDDWAKRQDKDTQIIIVEVVSNLNEAHLKIENHLSKNTEDLLKEYEHCFKEPGLVDASEAEGKQS